MVIYKCERCGCSYTLSLVKEMGYICGDKSYSRMKKEGLSDKSYEEIEPCGGIIYRKMKNGNLKDVFAEKRLNLYPTPQVSRLSRVDA